MRSALVLVVSLVACKQAETQAETAGPATTTTTTGATSAASATSGGLGTGSGGVGETTELSEGPGPETTLEGSSSTGGPAQDLVEVGHAREFRGVWVATVSNINWPGKQEVDPDAQKAELAEILDAAQAAGLNAVVFQVRPESDALYASALEPWSRYLTGAQGTDPGYDPLEYAVAQAHARGLELHAWFNPYRAKANKSSAAAPNHISQLYPEYAYTYGSYLWMDPAAVPVQERLVAVIVDVVSRYAVDGIHFDDYFYPYPDGDPFPDDSTWQAYVDGGGELGRADWRRDNVNRMVERVNAAIQLHDPRVRFGISPFGIYRPGMPPGIQGLDQYAELYADPLLWMQEGWLDYLAPQLYWPSTQAPQAYAPLIAWWSQNSSGGRHIFAGNNLVKLGSGAAWTMDEFRAQIQLTRDQAQLGARGNIYFHVGPFVANQDGVADVLRAEYYGAPALTPAIAAQADVAVEPPVVSVGGEGALVSHQDAAHLRAWVVYRAEGAGWAVDRIVPAAQTDIPLTPGTWAISAAGRHGVESAGVRVFVQ